MRRILLLAPLLLAACISNVETRGQLMDNANPTGITPGTSTRDAVLEALGSPSSKASFGQETWYYITTQRETVAFLKPEVIGREVTKITFTPEGVVETVESLHGEEARDVDIASRTTPTEGHQMTFMEQLFGNLGRFNSPAGAGSTKPGGTVRRPY